MKEEYLAKFSMIWILASFTLNGICTGYVWILEMFSKNERNQVFFAVKKYE